MPLHGNGVWDQPSAAIILIHYGTTLFLEDTIYCIFYGAPGHPNTKNIKKPMVFS